MQAVGKLDQNDADIFGHCDEDFPMIGGLIFRIVFSAIKQGADFGDGVHQIGDLFVKLRRQFFFFDTGIFNRIMQITGRDRLGAAMQFGQNIGDIGQMNRIRLAGFTKLTFMVRFGKRTGMHDQSKRIRVGDVRFCLPHDHFIGHGFRFLCHPAFLCIMHYCNTGEIKTHRSMRFQCYS